MLVSPIGQDSCARSNVQFKGFTKQLGKKIFVDGQKDIEELFQTHPNTFMVCGQLPEFLTKRLKSAPGGGGGYKRGF